MPAQRTGGGTCKIHYLPSQRVERERVLCGALSFAVSFSEKQAYVTCKRCLKMAAKYGSLTAVQR